jgi:tRNA pseudouridine32 synthase/23S rRNA pseudouridine746 synthase
MLRVIHDAEGVVVVDKPPGMETAGRTLDDPTSVQFQLAKQLKRAVWAVHQLDRDTSGVLVFVRRASLVAEWQARIKPPRGRKLYWAIVHGEPSFREQRIEAPLRYDEGARRWAVGPGGKPAISVVRVLSTSPGHALVEVELVTGRTHQARVHLAHLGHPLVGERRYREPACALHPRHALHAVRLQADAQVFEASLPADLRALCARLGLVLAGDA